MKTTQALCREDLLLALRMRDVPGDRIGDVLAEVEAHSAETAEDPVEAFGPATEYAREVAEAMGHRYAVWHLDRRTVGVGVLIAVLSGVATVLVIDAALWAAGAQSDGRWGLTAAVSAATGVVLALAAIGVVAASTWHRTVPVQDPRTGATLSRPPRWAVPAVFVGLFTLVAVVTFVVASLAG